MSISFRDIALKTSMGAVFIGWAILYSLMLYGIIQILFFGTWLFGSCLGKHPVIITGCLLVWLCGVWDVLLEPIFSAKAASFITNINLRIYIGLDKFLKRTHDEG